MATNVSGEKVGEIFAEIGVKFDKLDADFKKVESLGKKTAEKIEYDFKQLRLDIDNRLASMKLGEVKKFYQSLKIQMEQKIKFNADDTSIDKTAVAMDAARDRIDQLGKESEVTTNKMGTAFRKLGGIILGVFTIRALSRFTMEAIEANAELKDLRENFEGSYKDIELMKKATAEMVDDSDLLKMSNQASELGIRLEDHPKLFLLAANAAKKFGGDVVEGIDKIIRATEGQTRGLGKLGIERAKYNQEIQRLASLEGGKLEELDAEVQKRIKIQAVLNASKVTMEDVINRQASMNEQMKSVPALVQDAKEAFGSWFDPLLKSWLPPTIEFLKEMGRRIKELAQGRGANAAETIAYDFKGTTAKERADLITQWQADAAAKMAEFNKATADFRSYKMDYDEYKELTTTLEVQISTFKKLIELAQNYKEEVEETGGGLSPETIAERKRKANEEEIKFAQEQLKQDQDLQRLKEENIAKYYEEVKFKDENYFEWKADQILREISTEEIKNYKLKKLVDDRYEYERDKLTDPSLRGKTAEDLFNEISSGTIVRNPRKQQKADEDYAKKLKEDMLDAASEFGNALENAFGRAGDKFINYMNNAIQAAIKIADTLSKVSSGDKSTESGALNIFAAVLSLFAKPGAHDGGNFVGTPRGVMKMAGGGSFIVPSGYNNDSFPLMVETGERVTVTPARQINNSSGDSSALLSALGRVEVAVKAMNRNLVNKEFNANIFNPIDGTVLVKDVTQPSAAQLIKQGVNLGDFQA